MRRHSSKTPQELFAEKTRRLSNGCIEWLGHKMPSGYGMVKISAINKTQPIFAHRVAYMWAKGDIPPKFTIDHLCKNKWCVNPDHLEAVSFRTNLLRANTASGINARKTTCENGHPFDKVRGGKRIARYCSICKNTSARARRREKGNQNAKT